MFVLGAAGDAGAVCMIPPWFGVPASGTLPPKGSLYVQDASIEQLAEGFKWAGGAGTISLVDLGEVVRVDYDAGTATSLELLGERVMMSPGNAPQDTRPPSVIGIEHDGYDGDFVCARSSFATALTALAGRRLR